MRLNKAVKTLKALDILLVNPKWNGFGNRKKIKVSEKLVHPLSLGIIAGIIKQHNPNHKVRIVNQTIVEIPFNEKFDLIGITVNTYTAETAYTISKKFRENRNKVLLGGVHPSLCPNDCLKHADSVLVGEAEEILPTILDDIIISQLKKIYIAPALGNMSIIPDACRQLYEMPKSNAAFVQATRGCNNLCKFCYLRYTPWQAYRKRPVKDVISEIESIKEKIILFVDDNLFVDKEYCRELFEELQKLKIFWWAQAPTTLADDDELLEAAAKSGCFSLSYGFQTINELAIRDDKIIQNQIENYKTIVSKTQRNGIFVDGTFIFGFESDEPTIFKNTVQAIKDMKLDSYTLYMLTVYPDTDYYYEYKNNQRLITTDLSKFDWDHATIASGKMSAKDLEEGVKWAYEELDKYYRFRFFNTAFKNIKLLFKSVKLTKFLISSGIQRKYYNNY